MSNIETAAEVPVEPAEPEPADGATETTSEQSSERLFSQTEVNELIQRRLAEEKSRLNRRVEREVERRMAEREAELAKLIDQRVEERWRQRELEATRAAIVQEYGLNERQASVLAGETPEALRQLAEELFGALRRPSPPQIGVPANTTTGTAPEVFTVSQLADRNFYLKHREAIDRARREGRIIFDR